MLWSQDIPPGREKVTRISVSLPESVFRELDRMVEARGLENRSKAIAQMITRHAIEHEHEQEQSDRLMAGTITLIYDESRSNLLAKLAELQRRHIDEVISSLHVQLEHHHRMEVVLVQGPAQKLQEIADRLFACTGVTTGKLTLTSMIIPPLHPLPKTKKKDA